MKMEWPMERPPNISDADYSRFLESVAAARLLQPLGIVRDPVICGDGFDWVLTIPPYERFRSPEDAVAEVSKRWQCLRENKLGPGNPHPHALADGRVCRECLRRVDKG